MAAFLIRKDPKAISSNKHGVFKLKNDVNTIVILYFNGKVGYFPLVFIVFVNVLSGHIVFVKTCENGHVTL